MNEHVAEPMEKRSSWSASVWPWFSARLHALRRGWLRVGLPAKLLFLTAVFVMLAEILIFLPSIANYRISWLNDRLTAAHVASLAAEAVPSRTVPPALRNELTRTALVRAVAIRRGGARRLILPPVTELNIDEHFDLRQQSDLTLGEDLSLRLSQIRDAIAIYFASDDRVIRVIGPLGPRYDDVIEIVLPEEPLRRAMVAYGMNIVYLSIIISLLTAAIVYFAISWLLVRPMMRISRNMLHFGENPEDTSRIITPSGRADEIGTAERELAHMQRQLTHLLTQKNRLAQLGLAVSKISHDLRNMLANAQLISDRLTTIPDPTVQQFAPKLIASLDRAINFCNSSLRFGRAEEAEPRRELMRLKPLLEEVAEGFGLPREKVAWTMEMEDQLLVDADHEHLFRVLSNLTRNAVQAIESRGDGTPGEIRVRAWRERRKIFIEMTDDGPGIPDHIRPNLFRAFQASTRKEGSGLGLAIASELVAAHGGKLELVDTETPLGATFLIELPDRSVR
ncbi:HAMP domain-containing sensor histidine kinase [Hyphomicrobium sp.]|uniref:sensor histidine kinase n=1 Tax=Hyphomicrobium sp. TaxID=82 RepID=UPI002C7A0D76|nr:HAMP domain-containing sensor histidine kinase [Hyphomicrobium sp.]HRN87650.1 HAMP domain-containing sensor histidine kinase [Hyphomicrobium sp.]HRQ27710.1 HAMP domain-containing sensor histidine kinase [Hyphomicrobium sp.]